MRNRSKICRVQGTWHHDYPSPENAREAEEAGADIIVVTGFDEGDMDNGYVSVGNGISHIHQIKSCQAIIDKLTAHYAC